MGIRLCLAPEAAAGCCSQFHAPHKTGLEKLKRLQGRAIRMGRRLGHRRCKEKQRELDFFSLERGRLQLDLIAVSNLLPKGKGFLE